MNIFFEYEDFGIITKNWTILGAISMQIRVFFLRSKYKMGIFLGGY